MGEHRPDGYNPGPWLEALPGLQQRTDRWRWAGVCEVMLAGLVALTAVSLLRIYVFTGWGDGSAVFAGAVILLVTGVPLCIMATLQGIPRLVQWLKYSRIFDALAWDSPQDSPALDWLYRKHGGRSGTGTVGATEDWLVLITLHLDSLPSRSSVLPRFTAWLSQPQVTVVTWVVVFLASILYQANFSYPDDPVVAYAIYFLCLTTWAVISWRRFRPGIHAASIEEYFKDEHRRITREGRTRREVSDQRLMLLVDRLEQAFRRGNASLAWTAGYLSLLPVAGWVWLIYQFLAQFDFAMMAATVLMVLAVSFILFAEIPIITAMWQNRDIVEHLDDQGFLTRVIHQAGPVPEIMESVPQGLQSNLAFPRIPGDFTGGLAEVLWNIGYNLDWYMKPKPVLVRAGWIAAPLLHAIGVVLVASAGGIMVFNIEDYVVPGLVVVALGMVAAMFVIHDIARKFIWTRVFVHYLRKLIG